MSDTEDISAVDSDANKVTNQDNVDFDAEDIQRKRTGVINDLQSESIIPDDANLRPRKSVTSGRLIDDQGNISTPAIIDSSSNNPSQGPIRSMSESVIIDHHDTMELPATLPIQQDESSTEDDDDDNDFEGFSTDHKNVEPVDTDRDNQEVANISRHPSHSKSPLNPPRSPATDDSRQNLTNVRSKGPPTAIILPTSTNNTDQQKTSRSSSRIESKSKENSFESSVNQSNTDFLTTNDQSKLIKPGEQLRIPTNEIENERLNSPPPSPSTTKQMVLLNPLLGGNSRAKTEQNSSRPTSQTNGKSQVSNSVSNEKVIDGDTGSSKSRRSSNTSQQKRASKEIDSSFRTSAKQRQSPLQNRSGQQSRKNSNITTDQTVVSPIKIDSAKSGQKNQNHSSIVDSENEHLSNSKLPHVNSSSQSTTPTGDKQTTNWTKQVQIPPLQTTDDENPLSRPLSPNVEPIAEHNQLSTTTKKRKTDEQKKKEQQRTTRRSNSAESFNHIPLVDDKSLDSTSGNNTESDYHKQRRVKSKKKDMETNTDLKNNLRNGNHQQQQESTLQKPSKGTKSMSDHPPSIRRRLPAKELNLTTPDTEPDSTTRSTRRSTKQSKHSNEDKDPVNINVNVVVKNLNNEDDDDEDKQKFRKTITDNERHTQSDTEQIITEKQKKRRRPKRISRTTQTYECVFRRMEYGEHEELRPISDLDKNVQTKISRLRPRTKSPRRHYPIYLSTDAFKIEEILPKQFPHTQRNTSKTSVVARSNSPPTGKLLILRPTLPFHHTDAVNVQRVSLQYAIDLIPNENKSNDSTPVQRNKSNSLKQSEQTNNLPMLRSSPTTNASPNRSYTKDKSIPNRIEDRTYQRKDGGTV